MSNTDKGHCHCDKGLKVIKVIKVFIKYFDKNLFLSTVIFVYICLEIYRHDSYL